jgi:protein-tyrosine phosphatase
MKTKVLFVCMGNICRSPTAEGSFRSIVSKQDLSDSFEIDSAGTHAYHIGDSPDSRSQQSARKYGVDLSNQRARQVHESDFYYYDYIIAMDSDNINILKAICPTDSQSQIKLLLDYLTGAGFESVPDPYFAGKFDEVFEMVYEACASFLESLVKKT